MRFELLVTEISETQSAFEWAQVNTRIFPKQCWQREVQEEITEVDVDAAVIKIE
jgi:hypothetical protein